MDGSSNYQFLKWLAKARWLHHALFWLLIIGRAYTAVFKAGDAVYLLKYFTIYLAVYIPQVYFNIHFLYPRFFQTGKVVTYLLSVAVLIVVGTVLIVETYVITGVADPPFFTFFFSTLVLHALATGAKFFKEGIGNYFTIQELKSAQQSTELQALRSQINPHFLFNTLNNLYSLTLRQSSLAPEVVLKLSELMRYMTEVAGQQLVMIQQEAEYLEKYIDLEKIRLNTGVHISFVKQGDLTKLQIAPLLLLPLIENAFKHGVETQTENIRVEAELSLQLNQLFFRVVNSTPDHTQRKEKPSGTGIANLRRRLDLLYPANHELIVEQGDHKFTASLWIKI